MPVAHLSDRALLRLSGADVRDFLQGQITSDITALADDRPLYAGHLTPQGKTLFAFFLHTDGPDVLIDIHAGHAEALQRRLAMFKLRRDVAIAAVAGGVVVEFGETAARSACLAGEDPAKPVLDPPLQGTGSDSGKPADGAAQRTAAAQADKTTPAIEAWHSHRLAIALPDADEAGDLLWLETNAEAHGGVSFTKGCYIGQENTARMHHRDKVRRRLLAVQTAAEHPVGTPVLADTPHGPREAGTIRGARWGGMQMAHLRMEHADAALAIGSTPVALVRPGWL
jgi:folate-binding protein YgfZ